MGALRLSVVRTQINTDLLKSQLDKNVNVQGRLREKIEDFLRQSDIWTLEDVNFEILREYREFIANDSSLSPKQKTAYRSGLEQVMMPYLEEEYGTLVKQVDEMEFKVAIRNKLITFLMMKGVADAKEINYEVRQEYGEYVKDTVAASKHKEYIKPIDHLKLKSIKANESFVRRSDAPPVRYRNNKFFLLYYPEYEIAESFMFVPDKERLLFDFSLPGPEVLKRQVFEMLLWILENKSNFKMRQECFIVPLKLFYMYCLGSGVNDINALERTDVEGYAQSLKGKVGTKEKVYMQIVSSIRKVLFLNAAEIPWHANEWFLDRFHLMEERKNPAREIRTLNFDDICNRDNRKLFQEYIKYLIGVSQRLSLKYVNTKFYDIKQFLYFCDANDIMLETLNVRTIEDYINELNCKDVEANYYNRKMVSICTFINYLQSKELIPEFVFHLKYYLKKKHVKHNNRIVPVETELKVLKAIGKAPEHIRLMFLNVWGIGLRISEVCVVKGSSYIWDGEDAWISIYQNKMKSEKRIPIPEVVYSLMKEYIDRNNIGPNEYVFKNTSGGAFYAATFSKQMKKFLKDVDVDKDYVFKAHDYRHGIATGLHKSGTTIQTIRDYLGHNDENMTKQYIDYIPEEIVEKTDSYFENDENNIAKKILMKRKAERGKNNGKKKDT